LVDPMPHPRYKSTRRLAALLPSRYDERECESEQFGVV
jgi:hypothetical protein